jgi:ArsR family metal-binding transcriptional regulator
LIRHEVEISKCTPLFSEKNRENRKTLLEMLQAAGYNIPIMEDAKND